MPQPTAYSPATDFSDDEANAVGGRSTVRTAALDAELSALNTTLDQVLAVIALNQRDDGEIRDGRVKLHTLAADVRALLAVGGVAASNLRGDWVTATAYVVLDLVTQGGNTYICASAHTAGTFATDLAADRWIVIAVGTGVNASSVVFAPTATLAATSVQAAIEETDTENRALTASVRSELADVSTAGDGDAMVGWSAIYDIRDGLLTRHATLAAAVASIGSTRCTVVVQDDITMAASATFPSTAELRVENRAQITTTGYTFTAAKFSSGDWKCFAGTGTVFMGGDVAAKPVWFGAVSDGATDDSAAWAAAAAAGTKVIDCRGLNSRIDTAVSISSNQTWLLSGATITFASGAQTVLSAQNVDNWTIVGPFKIQGDGSTSGTAKGVSVSGGANWRVRDYTAESIRGWGFYYVPGASAVLSNHGYVSNFRAISCYRGWEDTAGTGAEYSTLESPYIRGCTEGLITAAGNTLVFGGQLVENGTNVILNNGTNHGHGAFIGTNINHGTTYNIRANSVLNGHDFIGCHIYGNSAGSSSGAIFLDTSRGIRFRGGIWDCHIYNYKGGSSALNWIQDMYCPGDYGIARQVGGSDGHDQLIITGCTGPGSYQGSGGKETAGTLLNDPSMCYVIAQRDAASTQSLTSGVAATLTFSATPPFPDRRGFANMGTGTFTVPASQAGLYRITVDLIFGGTSMTAASSFLEFKIGGTTKKLLASSAYSTTKVLIAGSFDYNLAVSDVMTFAATIVGTTPTFGDSTWPSNVTITRIA